MNKYEKTELMKKIGKQKPPIDKILELSEIIKVNLQEISHKEYADITGLLREVALDAYLYGRMDGRNEKRKRTRTA